MITKEAFLKFIHTYIEFETELENINKALNISLYDCRLTEYPGRLLDDFLHAVFNEKQIDTIYWYLFDKRFTSSLKMYDEDNKEIPTDTLDDIWKLIIQYSK